MGGAVISLEHFLRYRFCRISAKYFAGFNVITGLRIGLNQHKVRLHLLQPVTFRCGKGTVGQKEVQGGIEAVGLVCQSQTFADVVYLVGIVLLRQHIIQHGYPFLEIALICLLHLKSLIQTFQKRIILGLIAGIYAECRKSAGKKRYKQILHISINLTYSCNLITSTLGKSTVLNTSKCASLVTSSSALPQIAQSTNLLSSGSTTIIW